MQSEPTPQARTEYWRAHIDGWLTSGQSQQGYCRAHDLNYPRFGYWLRKFRQQDTLAEPRRPGFIPVRPAVPLSGSGLSLVLPSGLELRGIASDNLPVVQQLLNHLP